VEVQNPGNLLTNYCAKTET